jgi:RNA polymerase sigma-70 factor, ECF subfamily
VKEDAVAIFEEVYATEGPRLVTELYAVTGSLAEAEDIVQEAFVRAYGRWSRVGALEAPSAWVRRVALNLATSRFRALRRAARHAPRLHGRPEDDRPVPEDTVALVTALGKLPPRQRITLVLHYWADLPVAEIAEITGQPESTVKSHLRRGRAALAGGVDPDEPSILFGRSTGKGELP